MNHIIAELITLLLVTLTGVAAYFLGRYFQQADEQRTVACLVTAPCPACRHTYGEELAQTIARVNYDWMPLPGKTIAGLGLPYATFLVTCPRCTFQVEYRDNAQIFAHPQKGILDFTRRVQFKPATPGAPHTPSGAAIGKTLNPIS